MRQLRYSVAASLDGYIARPDGGFDWITIDPDIGLCLLTRPRAQGGGIPLLPTPGPTLGLRLRAHRLYPKTGTILLDYDVTPA